MTSRPLNFGDLVRSPDGTHGLLLTGLDDDDEADVAVALPNGTEEMVPPARLVAVPMATDSDLTANFAEWIVPTALPPDRAVYAFLGRGTPAEPADYDRAVVALFAYYARLIAGMPAEAFEDMTKEEYLRMIARTLGRRG